jgi:hypothetical protein
MRCVALVAVAGLLAVAAGANANIVKFDGGAPDFANGNEMTQWLQAEDFILDGDNVLKGGDYVWLDTGFGAGWDGQLQWFVFNNSGQNLPDGVVSSGNAGDLATTFLGVFNGFEFYQTKFSFGQAVPVTGGTRYWLGLHASADYAGRDEIYWGTTAAGFGKTGAESQYGTMNNWFSNGTQHSFRLQGVPEPASIALLTLGAIAALRRRR